MFDVSPLANDHLADITAIIDQKTKPLGALGLLEQVAKQLASLQYARTGEWQRIERLAGKVIVFAGDHGIAAQGVSIAPSDVTHQMVLNFLSDGAAINCFCQSNDLPLLVVDCGICSPIAAPFHDQARFKEHRLGAGTQDFSQQPAMTISQVNQGLIAGKSVAEQAIGQGYNVLVFGEMGIANTSSASALIAALLGVSAEQAVGAGTGINQSQLALKTKLVQQGLDRWQANNDSDDIYHLLAELGGFEIVQMVGAILTCAMHKIPVLVDGFIVSAAALVAQHLQPNVSAYLIFAHQSDEFAHQQVLAHFNAKPLLDLGLRLGEGTGAALAYPLLQAAVSFYNNMASFESAGVTV